MPLRNIQFTKSNYYHIYNRGAARQSIFRQEQDYTRLLYKIKEVLLTCQLAMIAYCLLPNHYHWLVRQDGDIPVRQLPKRVFGSYSQFFNRKYQRTGRLFERPFEAILVEEDDYLHHLCRYIHTNPVKHGLVTSPGLWPYSNYLDWVGKREGSLLDRNFIHTHFPMAGQYEAYVQSSLTGQVQLPTGLQAHLNEL